MTNVMINRDGKYEKLEHANLLDLPADERIWIQLVNPNEIEVRRIIDECYKEAKRILQENESVLHACAELLIEKERINREEFEALFV